MKYETSWTSLVSYLSRDCIFFCIVVPFFFYQYLAIFKNCSGVSKSKVATNFTFFIKLAIQVGTQTILIAKYPDSIEYREVRVYFSEISSGPAVFLKEIFSALKKDEI